MNIHLCYNKCKNYTCILIKLYSHIHTPKGEALLFPLKISVSTDHFPVLCHYSAVQVSGLRDERDRTRHLSATASAYENMALLHCTKVLFQLSSVKLEMKERLIHTYPGHSLRFQAFSAHFCKFWRGRTGTAHHNHFLYCHKYRSICRGDCSTLSSMGYRCQTVKKIPPHPFHWCSS